MLANLGKRVVGLCLWINVDSRRSQSKPARPRITLRTSVRVCPKFRATREQADRYQRRCEARLPLLKDGLPDEEAAFDFATPEILSCEGTIVRLRAIRVCSNPAGRARSGTSRESET